MDIGSEFISLMQNAAARLGRDLSADLVEAREYAAARMLHLSDIVDEAGYDEALVAERDNVALALGLNVADAADAWDREMLGLIEGALGIAARALAGS